MMNKKLEICCYSVESAIIAEQSGADRIELCDNYTEGGTTPSYAAIKSTLEKLNIPVNVIIRPRGGDFSYSNIEYEIIKEDVKTAKALGINGIVVGFLNLDGSIDAVRTKEIIEIAKPMEITFHRAFDRCNNPFIALEQLIKLGVHRVLTSGQKQTAIEGIEVVSKLVKQAQNKIIVMPGGGVNEKNILELISKTKATEYHSSAKTFTPSQMQFTDKLVQMGNKNYDENRIISVNSETIEHMLNRLHS